MYENIFIGVKNRFFQFLARYTPGSKTLRVWLHRMRGVSIGKGTFIGTDVLIDTAMPHWVTIGSGVVIGIRTVIIAHFDALLMKRELHEIDRVSVRIEDEVFVGPGVIILPNVKIGYGSVIAAGSVVTHSVPPLTMVQGNPAKPIARCGVPLGMNTPIWEFYKKLKKIKKPENVN